MKAVYRQFRKKIALILENRDVKYSIGSILLIIIISTVLLSINILGKTYDYSVGDISMEDIRVPRDIYYQDESETIIKHKRIQESVPLVFDKDANVLMEKIRSTAQFLNILNNVLDDNPLFGTDDVTFQLLSLKKKLPQNLVYPNDVLIEFIKYPSKEELRGILNKVYIYIYDINQAGILEKEYSNPLELPNENVSIRVLGGLTESEEKIKSLTDITTIETIKDLVPKIVYSTAPKISPSMRKAMTWVITSTLKSNLIFNPDETKRRISEKSIQIKPVMNVLKKGQTLVREGDTITADILARIHIHNKHTGTVNLGYIFGVFMLQFVFLLIFGYFIIEYKHILVPDGKSTIILSSMIIFFMFYTFFITRSDAIMGSKTIYILLLPIPFITMMLSILYNIYLAMLVGLGVVFFASVMGGGDISIIIFSFSTAILGVFINANVEKRTDFLRGGFFLGLINSIVLVSVSLMDDVPLIAALKNIHFTFASGIVNSILVLGILPLYENIFGITTKFKLLELADLNADIFKEMLMKAPGTYNHSLIVSTMAETACKDIQANYLLARVGAFYHDIGKINDSGMYIENKVTDPRAIKMTPRQYSSLIISHVEKGVAAARSQALPESVIDFIREHHGQTIMTFFYHQALEEASLSGKTGEIKKNHFQYPGPKPQTKETAVVMLADVIEAASRSLHEPDAAKLEGLVRKIIYNRLNEGDLELSDLSMTDLNTIERSFLKILKGIFHSRIEYPDAEDVNRLEKKMKKNWNKSI